MKESTGDNYRKNMARASQGGPDYRATDAGKGDVNRSRDKNKFDLGFELMEIAEEFGNDSPEYEAKLEEWRNAQA